MSKEAPNVAVREWEAETHFYQPLPGGEWVYIYESQIADLRAKGYPVKRVKTTRHVETEHLS